MNAVRPTTNWKDEAYRTIIKQGAWAALALLILSFLGMELHWFARSAGAAVTVYVQQSGENIKTLNAAVAVIAANVSQAQKQIEHCSDILEGVDETHRMQIEQQRDLLGLMKSAHTMMAPVPAKHDEQIRVLREIRDGMVVGAGSTGANP